jgi:hypothetical protein
MATITIDIPDDLLAGVKRVLEPIHRDVEDYVLAALHELTSDEPGAPLDAETEAALLEGVHSPPVEIDEAYWQRLEERAERFRRRTGT